MLGHKINDEQLKHFIASKEFAIKAFEYYLQYYCDSYDYDDEMEVHNYKRAIEHYVTFVSSYYQTQSKE